MLIYPLGFIGPWQIVIIALVILLLFGGKKIPELMSGLGKGVKSFKSGLTEIDEQANQAEDATKTETPGKEAERPEGKE